MLLTTAEAADYLGYKDVTLRVSRLTGKLSGLPAPKHIGTGANVRYEKEVLDKWLIEYIKG